jgi:hypothetical protein
MPIPNTFRKVKEDIQYTHIEGKEMEKLPHWYFDYGLKVFAAD